ncbi:MAG: uroporphyrinogen decarboxylase family protein [Clostridia bacterium]|jgi:hypothetical protein
MRPDQSLTAPLRVYQALSGGIPDRVPFVPKIWVDLAARLTGTDLVDVIEKPQTALDVLLEAALAVGADGVRQFHFPARRTTEEAGIVYEVDAKGTKTGRIDMQGGLGTQLFSSSHYQLEDPYIMAHCHYWKSPEPAVKSLADANRICVPGKGFYVELGWADRQRRVIQRAEDSIAIIGDCNSATLAFYETLRGMDQAMFDLIDEPQLVHAVMDKGLAIAIEKGKFNIDLGLRILRLNDSIANMSVISPGHWRQFIKPRITEFCAELHHYEPAVRIYCHICGNILPVLADLVETGLDCIAPLDPLGGFTCRQAREAVGQSVALMGGINTMSFLDKSPDGIAQEARACINGAGLQGGFILGSGCVVPRDAKADTLLAAAEAAHQFGRS